MNNNEKDPKEPQDDIDGIIDLKESIREMKEEFWDQLKEIREELGSRPRKHR